MARPLPSQHAVIDLTNDYEDIPTVSTPRANISKSPTVLGDIPQGRNNLINLEKVNSNEGSKSETNTSQHGVKSPSPLVRPLTDMRLEAPRDLREEQQLNSSLRDTITPLAREAVNAHSSLLANPAVGFKIIVKTLHILVREYSSAGTNLQPQQIRTRVEECVWQLVKEAISQNAESQPPSKRAKLTHHSPSAPQLRSNETINSPTPNRTPIRTPEKNHLPRPSVEPRSLPSIEPKALPLEVPPEERRNHELDRSQHDAQPPVESVGSDLNQRDESPTVIKPTSQVCPLVRRGRWGEYLVYPGACSGCSKTESKRWHPASKPGKSLCNQCHVKFRASGSTANHKKTHQRSGSGFSSTTSSPGSSTPRSDSSFPIHGRATDRRPRRGAAEKATEATLKLYDTFPEGNEAVTSDADAEKDDEERTVVQRPRQVQWDKEASQLSVSGVTAKKELSESTESINRGMLLVDADGLYDQQFGHRTTRSGHETCRRPYLDFETRQRLKSKSRGGVIALPVESHSKARHIVHIDFTALEILEIATCVLGLSVEKTTTENLGRLVENVRLRLNLAPLEKIASSVSRYQRIERTTKDIECFLRDCKSGYVSYQLRIWQVSEAQNRRFSRALAGSILDRELGLSEVLRRPARIQRQSASEQNRPSLKLCRSWGSTSGDLNTALWAADDDIFLLGSTVPNDEYNKNNNLLIGSYRHNSVKELVEHRTRPSETHHTSNEWMYETVTGAAFARRGNTFYTASYDKTVKVWDLDVQNGLGAVCTGTIQHDSKVTVLAASKFHDRIATAGQTIEGGVGVISRNSSEVLDQTSFNVLSSFTTKRAFTSSRAIQYVEKQIFPSCLAWGAQWSTQHFLAAGMAMHTTGPYQNKLSGDLLIIDANEEKLLRVRPNGQAFDCCSWFPHSHSLVTAGSPPQHYKYNSVVRFYDYGRMTDTSESYLWRTSSEWDCHGVNANCITFCDQDSNVFAVSYEDGATRMWDRRFPPKALHVLKHGPSLHCPDGPDFFGVNFASFGASPERFHSGSSDGVIKVWNYKRHSQDAWVEDLYSVGRGIHSGSFTSDYSKLLIGDSSGRVHILASPASQDDEDNPVEAEPRMMKYQPDVVAEMTETQEGSQAASEYIRSGQLIMTPDGPVQGPNYQSKPIGDNTHSVRTTGKVNQRTAQEDLLDQKKRKWFEREEKRLSLRSRRMIPVEDAFGQLVLAGDSEDDRSPSPPGLDPEEWIRPFDHSGHADC